MPDSGAAGPATGNSVSSRDYLFKGASCKTGFFVILSEVKDINILKIRDSSLRSE
jgi:hypothetical protein